MSINSMNSANALSFKGTITLNTNLGKKNLETGYIKAIKAIDNGLSTTIDYGNPFITTVYKIPMDTQTILNAYSAAKDSAVAVDITGYQTEE